MESICYQMEDIASKRKRLHREFEKGYFRTQRDVHRAYMAGVLMYVCTVVRTIVFTPHSWLGLIICILQISIDRGKRNSTKPNSKAWLAIRCGCVRLVGLFTGVHCLGAVWKCWCKEQQMRNCDIRVHSLHEVDMPDRLTNAKLRIR